MTEPYRRPIVPPVLAGPRLTFGALIARAMRLRHVEADGGVDAAVARGAQAQGPYR